MVHGGKGHLVCCGAPMELQVEKTEDEGYEKHVPVVEQTEKGINIKVGSVAHPMEENHYIEWIELVTDEKSYMRFLKPGQEPTARFCKKADGFTIRVYCNVHRLWKSL